MPSVDRRPLVLAVHGTRSRVGTETSKQLAAAVAERLGVETHLGWVDIHTPTLTDTLRRLGEAIVVPVFLTSGYHVTSDIPAAIAAAGSRAIATPLIGADERTGEILGQFFSEGLPQGACLCLYSCPSSSSFSMS